MKKILFIFYLLITFSVYSQEEKRLALVIGNSNYDSIAKLTNPVNDAKLIAKTLDSIDFDVILATDLDKGEFMSKVVEFGKKRADYDVGFVYYAGHGVQINGENYLLPTNQNFDEEWKIEEYAINVNRIMKYLTALTDQVNILILDACRNNPWEGNFRSVGGSNKGGLAKITVPTGSFIAFSTDAGAVAADGDGENSVYCKSLVRNMLLENTTLDQVFRNVRTDVLKESNNNQRPIENSQLTGQAFYLVKSNYEEEFKNIEDLLKNPKINYENIIELTSEILSIEKNNKRAFLYLGRVYDENGKFNKSLEAYNEALKIDSLYVDALQDRAILYSNIALDYQEQSLTIKEDNFFELSMNDLNRAIEIDSLSKVAHNRRGNLYYFYLDDVENGLKNYNMAVEIDSTYAAAIINRGSIYRELDSLDKSFREYNKLIDWNGKGIISISKKNQAFIYRNIGNLYDWDTDHELAIKNYKKAITLRPDWDIPHFNLVSLFIYKKDDENKSIHLKKYISLQPKNITGLFNTADIYRITKNYSSELEVYEQMELLFDSVDLRMKKLTAYNRNESYNDVIDLSKQMLDGDLNFQQRTFTLYFQAIAYENIDLIEKAEESYLELIRIEPLNENYRFLGRLYHDSKQYDKAIETYNLGLEIDDLDKASKDYAFTLNYRADSYELSNQPKKAINDWLDLTILDSLSSFDYFNEIAGTYRFELKNYEKAIEYYNKSIEFKPDYLFAYANKGILYQENLIDYVKAIQNFKTAAEISLNNDNYDGDIAFDMYNLIGETYGLMGDFEKALEFYSKSLDGKPNNLDCLFNRAYLYSENNLQNEALVDYFKHISIKGGNTYLVNNNIAVIYENYIKDFEKAIEYYTNAINLDPEGVSLAYRNRANVYFDHLEDTDKAIKLINKAIELDSLNPYNFEVRSSYYSSIDDFKNSLNDINKTIELISSKTNFDYVDLAEQYENRANLFIKLKDYDNAIMDWSKTHEIDSTYLAYAKYNIGKIYLNEIRDFERAVTYLTESLKLKYWKTEIIFSERSIAYGNLKKYSLALVDINKAIELDPNNRNYYYTKLNINLLKNDSKKSILIANKTIEMDRKDPQGFYSLAYIMNLNKDYYKSLNYVSISIEKLISNNDYYISDFNGLDRVLLTDLYKFRANIYSKIQVFNLMCDDYNLALDLTLKDENKDIYNELTKLISENCDY